MNQGRMIRIDKTYADIIDSLIQKGIITISRARYIEKITRRALEKIKDKV